MSGKRTAGAGVFLAALLVLVGCGEKTTTVSGTVTLDGKPLPEGAISFFPKDGQAPTAGSTIKDGQYSAKLSPCPMKVTISAPKVVGTKKIYDTPDSPVMPITKEALPAKYNEESTLELEVKPGPNRKDFELTSK
jgi:hypothetical protein